MNDGERQITQSLKVRSKGVIFSQFLNCDDHITAICRKKHIICFHIKNIGKNRYLLSYNACSTIAKRSFIYAAPCQWNKLSEYIRASYFDCFGKSVKTMLFIQQYASV